MNKRPICDAISSKDIDINYVDSNGNHLLNYVVLSYMPEKWKVDAIHKMIEMGIDVNHSNKSGKTALDLAKFKGEVKLARMLETKP